MSRCTSTGRFQHEYSLSHRTTRSPDPWGALPVVHRLPGVCRMNAINPLSNNRGAVPGAEASAIVYTQDWANQ